MFQDDHFCLALSSKSVVVGLWSERPRQLVVFAVVDGQIRLCLIVQAKWKDDESVSALMTSSQTES